MGVRESLRSRCTGHAGVSGLIGTRCYPMTLPQNAQMPAVTYQLISTPPNNYQDHDGTPDRWTYRVQLDAYADTSDGAAALGDQLFAAFAGWSDPPSVGWSVVQNRQEQRDTILNLHRNIVEIVIDHEV